jgi:hypothetical protein
MSQELGGFESRLLEELTALDAARPAAPYTPLRRTRRLTRPAFVLAAVVGLLAVGGAATAASILLSQPGLAVPDDAYPGGPLFVKGIGCKPGTAVVIRLDGATLGRTAAHEDESFWANLTLPSTVELGRHTVSASCTRSNGTALTQSVTVTVGTKRPPAYLQQDFVVGGAAVLNGEFAAKGAGCKPGTTVSFSVAGATLGTATAGDDGGYTAVLPTTGLGLGQHTVDAECAGRDGAAVHLSATLVIVSPGQAAGTKTPAVTTETLPPATKPPLGETKKPS